MFSSKNHNLVCDYCCICGSFNLVRTATEVDEAVIYLKTEFKMKDLRKTKYCLGIQVEHLSSQIFLHQSTHTKKVLNRFYMDEPLSLTTPMVVRSLEHYNDPFQQREDDVEVLSPESHILEQLVHLCIVRIIQGQILLLL